MLLPLDSGGAREEAPGFAAVWESTESLWTQEKIALTAIATQQKSPR